MTACVWLSFLLHLHKWQERQECKQRETEMTAAAKHAEEHTAKIHNKEDAQLLTFLPIEPKAHYQEDDINHTANYSRIQKRRYDWIMREIVTFGITIEFLAVPLKIFESLTKDFLFCVITRLPKFKGVAPTSGARPKKVVYSRVL